jgi:hypothetical protein
MLENLKLRQFSKKLKQLQKENNSIYQKYDVASQSSIDSKQTKALKKDLDEISKEIDRFIENDYAFAVFEIYRKKKPQLVSVSSGEKISWDDAFGDSFDDISKSLRHSLVGLVESPGRYKFL